jgi:hypothetical protein
LGQFNGTWNLASFSWISLKKVNLLFAEASLVHLLAVSSLLAEILIKLVFSILLTQEWML